MSDPLCSNILQKFPGAYLFQVVVSGASPLVLIGRDLGDPENNHPVCRQGKFQRTAVYVYELIKAQPALNFLGIALRIDNKVFWDKHFKRIYARLLLLQDRLLSLHLYSIMATFFPIRVFFMFFCLTVVFLYG